MDHKKALEAAFEKVNDEIKNYIQSLKQLSSDEILNGSIEKAQKILLQIIPVQDGAREVEKEHVKFLEVIKSIKVDTSNSAQIKKEAHNSPKTEPTQVQNDEESEELMEEELLEEEIETNESSGKEFRLSILKALIYLGGSAKIEEIFNFIERDMRSKFKTKDLEVNGDGQAHWKNAVKTERTNMVEQGLLSADSTNGTWEIVQKGIDYLSQQK